MFDPGDVIVIDFPAAILMKRRPAVVISTTVYHTYRPDVVVGLLTTQIQAAKAPTDYLLLDWAKAGLRKPSAFRSYLATLDRIGSVHVGRLTERDWLGVQASLARALAIPSPQNP
jgi:mRNA interferase MazF